ncbi:methyltransferase domain-containing protein [Actinosynnema sp. NPDC047251]|uniref:class I SAM-dependent methyltransferase n=1 Tax=Saccharothrix espanaensis TaxID=103731 RepID=UPI001E581F53|nr:methyltransferase domain-containing protein [Saccharothrix espanaensis]
MERLLDNEELERSSVVANRDMNRERGLAGSNGYGRELGLDVAAFLAGRAAARSGMVEWLDLCCGTGTALLECAAAVADPGVRITGVDLVDHFAGPPVPGVESVTASVASWRPDRAFDLITCVHGLHYVGDKLGVPARSASWLADDGVLAANLDLAAIRSERGTAWGRPLSAAVRAAGFDYDARRRRVGCVGRREVSLPFGYLGADDRAGPNYTGQPAVYSYYTRTAPL